jgi:uncharacterized membrane protein YcaP (DUF421 family)
MTRPFDWYQLWTPELSPLEIVVRSTLVYLGALVLLRVVGRKELARYSPSDFLFVLLLSQALRQTLVGSDKSLTSGFVALATLLGVNLLLSRLSFRSRRFAAVVKGRPTRLVSDGRPVEEALRRSRFTLEEIRSRLRRYGIDRLELVDSAWLELDGNITFVLRAGAHPAPV